MLKNVIGNNSSILRIRILFAQCHMESDRSGNSGQILDSCPFIFEQMWDISSFKDPSACGICRFYASVTLDTTSLTILPSLPSFSIFIECLLCVRYTPVPVDPEWLNLCFHCVEGTVQYMEGTNVNKQVLFSRESQSSGETTHKLLDMEASEMVEIFREHCTGS